MGGENKKSNKKRVGTGKISAYWSWHWPKNKARKALAAFKDALKESGDTSTAHAAARRVWEAADAAAANSPNKPAILVQAEFERILKLWQKEQA